MIKKFANNKLFTIFVLQTTRVRPHKNLKKMKQLVKAIMKIAQENPDGFTIEILTLTTIEKGYVSAYKETQDSFGIKGLEKVIEHAQSHDKIVGGWFNEDNNQFYFDINKIFDNLEEAI